MKISFFSAHKEYQNPKKNGNGKFWFGVVNLLFGFSILAIDGGSSGYPISASGSILHAIVGALNELLGKWVCAALFFGIGVLLIRSGIREIRNSR